MTPTKSEQNECDAKAVSIDIVFDRIMIKYKSDIKKLDELLKILRQFEKGVKND